MTDRETMSIEEAFEFTIKMFKECQAERDQLKRYINEFDSRCARYHVALELIESLCGDSEYLHGLKIHKIVRKALTKADK